MSELLAFVETSVFTKRLSALGLEESLGGLQLELLIARKLATSNPVRPVSARFVSVIRHVARASAEERASISCGFPIGAAFI
jgi:hypothetical protein